MVLVVAALRMELELRFQKTPIASASPELLFSWLMGVRLGVSLSAITLELVVVVLVPTVVGVGLRTAFPGVVSRYDSAYAGLGSVVYLLILLAVVGPNAETIVGYGWYSFVIAGAALSLNLIGYGVGLAARLITSDRKE